MQHRNAPKRKIVEVEVDAKRFRGQELEEGKREKEEGERRKEEGGRRREEGGRTFASTFNAQLSTSNQKSRASSRLPLPALRRPDAEGRDERPLVQPQNMEWCCRLSAEETHPPQPSR